MTSWQQEFNSSLKTIDQLRVFFKKDLGKDLEKDFKDFHYPVFLPLKLARQIKKDGPNSPLWKQFLPDKREVHFDPSSFSSPLGLIDPIGDAKYLKAPQLIHRYKNRALFMPTSVCPINCRYCFRKNELNTPNDIFLKDFDKTLDYLKHHPEIEEIIFTGGDPLILSNNILRQYFTKFSKLSTIKYFRIHSKTPTILPSRIDNDLLQILTDYNIKLVLHINHKDEILPDVTSALAKLKNHDILSQTVLLKGVNDNPKALIDLYQTLISHKIRPYYLHHPDQVKGAMHFYLSLEAGRRIFHQLKNHLPGWAVPHYVIDIPGGHGKVNAFNPESYAFSGQLLDKSGDLVQLS